MFDFREVSLDEVGPCPAQAPPAAFLYRYAELSGEGGLKPELPAVFEMGLEGKVLGWLFTAGKNAECLPGRMYGYLPRKGADPLDLDALYRELRRSFGGNYRVHLLPQELVGSYVGTHRGKISRYENHHTFVLRAGGVDEAWGQLKRVGRQGVAKAEKSGLVVREGFGGASVMQYLAMHVGKSARKGSPAMTRKDVDGIRRKFGDDAFLHMAYLDGVPIAGVLSLRWGTYGMLVDNASKPAHWDLNPNNMVVWSAVKNLVERGVHMVDYGFTPAEDEGGARFKEHMGGTKMRVYTVGAR